MSSGCPSRYILETVAVVPGVDGRKMSKSYNNTIDIFDDPAVIRKKVKKIVTDSTPVEAPKNPDTCPLFSLFKLFAAPEERAEVERRVPRGGDRLRRNEEPAGRVDHRRGSHRPANSEPSGWRIPSASPRSGRQAPPVQRLPPAVCSTGLAPPADVG